MDRGTLSYHTELNTAFGLQSVDVQYNEENKITLMLWVKTKDQLCATVLCSHIQKQGLPHLQAGKDP